MAKILKLGHENIFKYVWKDYLYHPRPQKHVNFFEISFIKTFIKSKW